MFFFQAEDGIRDYKVTGVQTCALPISAGAKRSGAPVRHPMLDDVAAALVGMGWRPAEADGAVKDLDVTATGVTVEALLEIGRASCREREVETRIEADVKDFKRESRCCE